LNVIEFIDSNISPLVTRSMGFVVFEADGFNHRQGLNAIKERFMRRSIARVLSERYQRDRGRTLPEASRPFFGSEVIECNCIFINKSPRI